MPQKEGPRGLEKRGEVVVVNWKVDLAALAWGKTGGREPFRGGDNLPSAEEDLLLLSFWAKKNLHVPWKEKGTWLQDPKGTP